MSSRAGAWLSAAVTAALVAYLFLPTLRCPTECIVDPVAVHGPGLGHIELPDVHLNAWILAWVQRSLLQAPGELFDANVFHPARGVLTQSEHMLAVALWTLPSRVVSDSAVWLHQVALVGSSLLLALTTGALVRWLTASAWAGFAAGIAALFMPWRFTELAHVQLMNAQWIPLVWLGIGRVMEDPTRRRPALVLAVALLLQLLSSFYLAYFLLLSCAGLLLGLWIVDRPSAAAWRRLGLAAAVPLACLVATALPYLRWSRQQGFRAADPLFDSVPPADVLALTLDGLPGGLRGFPLEASFAVPLLVALLAAVSFVFLRGGRGNGTDRRRGFVVGLTLACVAAWVLALGRRIELGGASIPLPGSLFAAWVPGFENLRNPLRFAIVIGVAAPVLAGVGFARLESLAKGHARTAVRIALLLLLAANLVTPPMPARDAWADNPARPAHRVLAALPRGAVVEIPWPLQNEHDAIHAGRAMLGSTLHWQPLLNGHSGYRPRSYDLLRQVARELPAAEGIARLTELCDVRWILVHMRALDPAARAEWREAARDGRLRVAFEDDATSLFELPRRPDAGRYEAVLAGGEPRDETLAGLSRAPLSAADASGRIELEVHGPFHFAGRRRLPRDVTLRLENRGTRSWPGLDAYAEGLVALRTRFVAEDGEVVVTDLVPLAADVSPGRTTLRVPVFPPARAGRYRLRAELVQQVGGETRALGPSAAEESVEVRPAL